MLSVRKTQNGLRRSVVCVQWLGGIIIIIYHQPAISLRTVVLLRCILYYRTEVSIYNSRRVTA